MKIIVNNTIKGGSGKTLFSIIMAKYLSGKKLIIDSDINNSLSFWALNQLGGIEDEILSQKNLYKYFTLLGEDPNIKDFTIKLSDSIDIVLSEVRLNDFYFNLTPNRLLSLKEVEGYDYIIIDTPPTYSMLIYNFFQIADVIVCPTLLDLFSSKSLAYTLTKIEKEQVKIPEVKVIINQHERGRGDSSYQGQLISYFENINIINKYLVKDFFVPRSIIFKQINDGIFNEVPISKSTAHIVEAVDNLIKHVK